MALADVVKLGIALGEAAKIMRKEESLQHVGFTIPNTRLTYEDIEYLGRVVSKELPCKVGCKRQKGAAIVVLMRKEGVDERTKI